jgi:multidrug resistance efflux pump
MSPAAVEKADAATSMKASECRSAEAKIRSLSATRLAARSGVFLGDGYNDAPYAVQQADRILLQRQAIERTLSDATADQRETQLRLKDALTQARYTAPAGTLVWATLASTGTSINEGVPVLDLLDCRRRFVQVALPERKAESVLPDDPANVRLIGSDQWLKGRVTNITGAAGRRKQDLLAASTYSLPGAREIIVDIALPPPAAGQYNPGRNCDVGRMAEVRFSRRL